MVVSGLIPVLTSTSLALASGSMYLGYYYKLNKTLFEKTEKIVTFDHDYI